MNSIHLEKQNKFIRFFTLHLAFFSLPLCTCASVNQGGFPWPLENKAPLSLSPDDVQTLTPDYHRSTSRVMIRKILRPTRANLDFAAYSANIILHQPDVGEVTPGQTHITDPQKLFGGVILVDTLTSSIRKTPLTPEELSQPMAFSPLVDYLAQWNSKLSHGLEKARTAVKTESWGNLLRPGTYFQQISTLYLHRGAKGLTELWVRIEFQPSAKLYQDMPDEDGDGYPEIYGRLKPELLSKAALRRIKKDYLGRLLSTKEVHRWANELASYWYPSFNTDVVKQVGKRVWPFPDTEEDIVASLNGRKIHKPTVIIRGKPNGQALYNVFAIEGCAPLDGPISTGQATISGLYKKLKRFPVTVDLDQQTHTLKKELQQLGRGKWQLWANKVALIHKRIKKQLKKRPQKLQALIGQDGFLFYRKSLDYIVGGDLQRQPKGKNPFPIIVEFKQYLSRLGVDFLLVPVPTKAEVFPEKLKGEHFLLKTLPILNPLGRKFFTELTQAKVEIVDLLPLYLEERLQKADQPLYQPQDTHWTDRGLRLAAKTIAQRIKRYPWYKELQKHAVNFSIKETTFKRFGDLHSRLAATEQTRYKPDTLTGHQVFYPDGKPYEDDIDSPIVVLGDSFTGVYQRTDCLNAGVSAQIAKQIEYPVDLVMSYGGGPNVRRTLLSRGEKDLRKRRLVIWIFAARDLYNYWEDWELLQSSKIKK